MHGNAPPLRPIESQPLALPGIAHAFFTREGGVSTGIYRGLNTGTGSQDSRDLVLENRARAARHLGACPDRLASPHQVHGTEAVVVREAWLPGKGPKADAVVTDTPGIAIGVGAADCGPVLFADANTRIVGAAHAGWRGAFTGVLESTINAMEKLGASRKNVVAMLGPTISSSVYEVGPEFVARFIEADAANDRFFKPGTRAGHAMFDLPAYIVARLQAAGVAHAGWVGSCTYSDEQRFFSYRRATHRGEPNYGRQISLIGLPH
jgi:YfiH family protein